MAVALLSGIVFGGCSGAAAYAAYQRWIGNQPHDVNVLVDQQKTYSLVRSQQNGRLYFMLMRDVNGMNNCGKLVPYESWQGAARDAGLVWTQKDTIKPL
jgi:hypothetical protein